MPNQVQIHNTNSTASEIFKCHSISIKMHRCLANNCKTFQIENLGCYSTTLRRGALVRVPVSGHAGLLLAPRWLPPRNDDSTEPCKT